MRLQVITSGRHTPSARFRHRQYYALLREQGIELDEYRPAVDNGARLPGTGRVRMRYLLPIAAVQVALNLALRIPALLAQRRYDLRWVERNFVPGADWLGWLLRRPYVLDLDDAVWLYSMGGEAMTSMLVRRARGVTVGNSVIADWCRAWNDNVCIVPTAIDCSRFVPLAAPRNDGGFTVGWTGTSSNFRHLHMIEAGLAKFLRRHPEARLAIVAERAPTFRRLDPARIDYVPWTPESEVEEVQRFDVGIMPLADDPVSRAKCSFKMLQYMAAGKPVAVSSVGLNEEILRMADIGIGVPSADDWFLALERMFESHHQRAAWGREGRRLALERFDTRVVARTIEPFLRACV